MMDNRDAARKLFRFYDLRHTGNTLATDIGAKLKDLMVRARQSSERAQLIYQHSAKEHQRKLAAPVTASMARDPREVWATNKPQVGPGALPWSG